jgi:hypothetical protein
MSGDNTAVERAKAAERIRELAASGVAVAFPRDFGEQLAQQDLDYIDVLSMLMRCSVERAVTGTGEPALELVAECDDNVVGAQVAVRTSPVIATCPGGYLVVKRIWRLSRY